MYIFPTKALAQDQKRALEDIMQNIPELEDVMVCTRALVYITTYCRDLITFLSDFYV